MHRRSFLHSAALVALAQLAGNTMTPDALAAAAKQQGDPLLDEWTGPHGGMPRFDLVKVDAFKPANQTFHIYTSAKNDKSMQAVETEMAPLLSAFGDEVIQNEALFARLKAVYDTRENAKLSPEQQRLADVVHTNFARRGAALD